MTSLRPLFPPQFLCCGSKLWNHAPRPRSSLPGVSFRASFRTSAPAGSLPGLKTFRPNLTRTSGGNGSNVELPTRVRYDAIVKPEDDFRRWRISTAGVTVRVSTAYLRARLLYDTMTAHPKLVMAPVEGKGGDLTDVHLAGGVSIPCPPGMPVGAFDLIIAEELCVTETELYDCVSSGTKVDLAETGDLDLDRTETLRPGRRWSRYTNMSDVMAEAMQGASQGFFIAIRTDPEREAWKTFYVEVPSFEERIAPALALLEPLRTRYAELSDLKAKIDGSAADHARFVVRSAFFGLTAYTVLAVRLIWFDFDWDVIEPVTYVVNLVFATSAAAFYLRTSRTFSYEALQATSSEGHRRALYARQGFDVDEWERVGAQVKELEEWIAGVRRGYD